MSIRDSILRVSESIAQCVHGAGRKSESVQLMAVSKFHPVEEIQEAIDCGLCLYGENRVQEADEKFSVLLNNNNINLHMIGSLQRNKVKKIVKLATCIQSVDRLALIEEIQKYACEDDKIISILFEVHTGEESKAGFLTEDSLYEAIEYAACCKNISCNGFMTMAPFCNEESIIRASFKQLRETAEKARKAYPQLNLTELSMGMSNDYKIAIQEGSTLVRIGTAIFGGRS